MFFKGCRYKSCKKTWLKAFVSLGVLHCENPAPQPGARLLVAAIVLWGRMGDGLIVAYSGFGTLPKHGGAAAEPESLLARVTALVAHACTAVATLIAVVFELR